MVAVENGELFTENSDVTNHSSALTACYVDIQPWDLEIVRLPYAEDDPNTPSLISCLWGHHVNGKTSREPLALAARVNDHNCMVVPRRASAPPIGTGSSEANASWRALTLPSTQPLATLHFILARAGHEVLIFAAPSAGQPCAVVRVAELASVVLVLIASGFAVGPSTQLCATPGLDCNVEPPTVSSRAGVWSQALPGESLTQEADLPYAVRFESGIGHFIDIRIPTSHGNASQQSVEASSCGSCVATKDGITRHRIVSLQPPTPNINCPENGDDSSAWKQVEPGCTVVLELLSSGSQRGLWIFCGNFFARLTGLARGEGLVAGYCCSDARRLEQLMGDAVGAELRSQYEAILGRVDRPGVLRVLRRSWIEPAVGTSPLLLYDGEQGEGGLIEVDREAALVVHHTLGGGQERWRILAMDQDPFTPAGGARYRVDEDFNTLFTKNEASKAQPSESSDSDDRKKRKKNKRGKSRSPSIVLFDEKQKRVVSLDKKDRKHRSHSSDSSKSKKAKGKKRGRDRDTGKGRSESSSKSASKAKKRKRDRSSTDGDKKDKKRSGKDNKKRRSHSRKSEKGRSRSKSKKKKKGRSRSKSKRRKDRSRSRSKKKKNRSKSRSKSRKRRDKRSRSRSDSNARKGSSSLSLKKRLGGFDSRAALPETAIAPATAGLPIIVTRPTDGEPLHAMTLMQTQEIAAEIEVFLKQNVVDANACTRLRNLPPHMARHVLNRGSLLGARDAGAVLNSRIRDAMLIGQGSLPIMSVAAVAQGQGRSAGQACIDTLITRYSIDSQCAQMLRQLPPHLQAAAMELPVHEARNPSAFVMAQLQLPKFRHGGTPGGPQMFQVV